MAIEFVDNVVDQESGMQNSAVSKLAALRTAHRTVTQTLSQADASILNMVKGPVLPGIPPLSGPNSINQRLGEAKQDLLGATNAVTDVTGLAGSCLDGATNAITSIQRDAFGMVDTTLSTLNQLPEMLLGSDTALLSGAFGRANDLLGNLGVAGIIGSLTSSLGCMSGNPITAEIEAELASITAELGLNPDGSQDSVAYKQMMLDKMTSLGLPVDFAADMTDSLSVIADTTAEMGNTAKDTMKTAITTAKGNIPKLPALSKYF